MIKFMCKTYKEKVSYKRCKSCKFFNYCEQRNLYVSQRFWILNIIALELGSIVVKILSVIL